MSSLIRSSCAIAVAFFACATVQAQTIAPEFAGAYTLVDLGAVPGVPTRYGGLTFKRDNPNVILLGGEANSATGALYAVSVVRDMDGHITGFDGDAVYFAAAAHNDGGVAYHPESGVLFTSRWPVNQIGQLKPGSTVTDKIIDLGPFAVASSNASVNFVPGRFPGAGRMKIASWSGGEWYDVQYEPDGFGTFDITTVTPVPASNLPNGPEGFTFVPFDSPIIGTDPSIIVSEYSAGSVAIYALSAEADPIIASRRLFISNLVGAEGAVIDPLTGDFLFSTFGFANHLIRVTGFSVPTCCEGNADGIGSVNFADITSTLTHFLETGVPGGQNPGDANCDGTVNFADITSILENFNANCD